MARTTAPQFFTTLKSDHWALRQAIAITNKLVRDPVFRALGNGLREAMIAKEVMALVVATSDVEPCPTPARHAALYQVLLRHLLPEVWG